MFYDTISTGRSTSSDCHNNIHAKEMLEMEQVVSDCRCSKKEQDTLNNILLRQINQNDDTGVYVASKDEIEILREAQQKRHVIQKNYLFGDNTANLTSNQGRSSDSDCQNNKHTQEIKEMEQVASDCRCSKKEQETLNNKLSRKINQNDAADGVYSVSKDKFEILKVAQQKRRAIQKNYYIIDNDTGKERIYSK